MQSNDDDEHKVSIICNDAEDENDKNGLNTADMLCTYSSPN